MSFEYNLRYLYDTNPNELQKNFNLEVSTRQLIFQVAQNTQDEKVIQIIGTLIANYVDLNHSKIDQELKRDLENHAWVVLSTIQAQKPAYVFYAQILANILFNFYEQTWSNEFIEKVQQLIWIKPDSGFVVVEEIIRRLKPHDESHKESMISFDSRYRAIKNLFYKQHLSKLIDIVLSCFQYPELINQSLNIFLLILEIEFITDTRTKDWHILKSAEVKNILTLELQLKECRLQLLEDNILVTILQQNSNNPFSNELGYLWDKVRDVNFILYIVDLVPQFPQAHKILKKICKIFKKHFKGETAQIIQMTIRLQQLQTFNKGQVLSLAGKTLFASCDINWLHFNLSLMDASCIIESFKFMRDLCRIARTQDYSTLHQLLMPKIDELYTNYIKTGFLGERKPIKYSMKVISSLMIEQYLIYFFAQIKSAQNPSEQEIAFEFFYIGLLASMSATSYQLDYMNKIRFIQESKMLYPVNVQLFKQFDYVSFYRIWLNNAHNVQIVLQNESGRPSIYIYKLWKKLLNPKTNIEYQDIIGNESNLYLNFNEVVNLDIKYIIKSFMLILNSKIQWKSDTSFEINRIEIPVSGIEIFNRLTLMTNPKVGQYYYTIQSKFVNAQCEWLQDVDNKILLKQTFSKQVFELSQKMTQEDQILFFTSILKEEGSSSYVEIMKNFQTKEQFDLLLDYRVPLASLLKLSLSMISESQIDKLNQQIVNNLFQWILNLSEKLLSFLELKYIDQQKERQVKRQQKENYKEYYKPLILAMRLFEKTRCLNKSKCSYPYKEKIPLYIFRILDLIFIDDLSAYINKMYPLFQLIKQIMIAQTWKQAMQASNLITIVKFIDQAIQIQERKTLSLALQILNEIMSYQQLIMIDENLFHYIIIQCLNLSFIYNQFVKQVSQIVLRYIVCFPQNYDVLFLIELPQQIIIQPQILQYYISKVECIRQFIPDKISKEAEKDFQDYFVQLQILCCYYI